MPIRFTHRFGTPRAVAVTLPHRQQSDIRKKRRIAEPLRIAELNPPSRPTNADSPLDASLRCAE